MLDLMAAAGSAALVIFVAELGDKSQLLAVGFGARQPLRTVVIGLAIGYAAAGAIAAAVGGLVGAALPARPLTLVAGGLFLAFALLALRDIRDAHDDDDDDDHAIRTRSVVASIAITIAVAEMGDKTQLATAVLASQANPVATWVGATVGEVSAGVVGAVAGREIADRVGPRAIRIGSAVLFAVFGLVLIVTGW